jgi:transcriptional regulator with XRE-family HTH domain
MAWQKLGAQIRALRLKRALTQDALAEQAGLSAIYIRKLEAGERLSPSLPALERVAGVLGATLHIELVERPARRTGGRHGR